MNNMKIIFANNLIEVLFGKEIHLYDLIHDEVVKCDRLTFYYGNLDVYEFVFKYLDGNLYYLRYNNNGIKIKKVRGVKSWNTKKGG